MDSNETIENRMNSIVCDVHKYAISLFIYRTLFYFQMKNTKIDMCTVVSQLIHAVDFLFLDRLRSFSSLYEQVTWPPQLSPINRIAQIVVGLYIV